jgi:hypothetical protein
MDGYRNSSPVERAHFHIAQVCLNGHMINSSTDEYPESNADHCDRCGEETISKCTECSTDIRGYYDVPGVVSVAPTLARDYCHE